MSSYESTQWPAFDAFIKEESKFDPAKFFDVNISWWNANKSASGIGGSFQLVFKNNPESEIIVRTPYLQVLFENYLGLHHSTCRFHEPDLMKEGNKRTLDLSVGRFADDVKEEFCKTKPAFEELFDTIDKNREDYFKFFDTVLQWASGKLWDICKGVVSNNHPAFGFSIKAVKGKKTIVSPQGKTAGTGSVYWTQQIIQSLKLLKTKADFVSYVTGADMSTPSEDGRDKKIRASMKVFRNKLGGKEVQYPRVVDRTTDLGKDITPNGKAYTVSKTDKKTNWKGQTNDVPIEYTYDESQEENPLKYKQVVRATIKIKLGAYQSKMIMWTALLRSATVYSKTPMRMQAENEHIRETCDEDDIAMLQAAHKKRKITHN